MSVTFSALSSIQPAFTFSLSSSCMPLVLMELSPQIHQSQVSPHSQDSVPSSINIIPHYSAPTIYLHIYHFLFFVGQNANACYQHDNFPLWLMQIYSSHMSLYQDVTGTWEINCIQFFYVLGNYC